MPKFFEDRYGKKIEDSTLQELQILHTTLEAYYNEEIERQKEEAEQGCSFTPTPLMQAARLNQYALPLEEIKTELKNREEEKLTAPTTTDEAVAPEKVETEHSPVAEKKPKVSPLTELSIPELLDRQIELAQRITAQQNSRVGGIVPPHLRTKILDGYKHEKTLIDEEIKNRQLLSAPPVLASAVSSGMGLFHTSPTRSGMLAPLDRKPGVGL